MKSDVKWMEEMKRRKKKIKYKKNPFKNIKKEDSSLQTKKNTVFRKVHTNEISSFWWACCSNKKGKKKDCINKIANVVPPFIYIYTRKHEVFLFLSALMEEKRKRKGKILWTWFVQIFSLL